MEISWAYKIFVPDYVAEKAQNITCWETSSEQNLHPVIRIDTLKKCYEIIYDWYETIA